ncbi:MAG TPA: hypothetical protein VJ836_07200 [Candidatus Saccharimonadales bacterium]|nr:hypothetical protein [Candidatus Saccharimonadales bacterium]
MAGKKYGAGVKDNELDDSLNPAHIKQQEEQATQQDAPASDQEAYDREFDSIAKNYDKGTGKEPSNASDSLNYTGKGADKTQLTGAGKAKGLLKRYKWAILSAGGAGLLAIAVLALLQLGSLIIPNFTQHMVAYEFARLSRQTASSAMVASSEKAAMHTLPNSQAPGFFRRMANLKNNLLEKTYNWRPQKSAQRLLQDIDYTYRDTPIKVRLTPNGPERTYQRLASITVDGKAYPAPPSRIGMLTGQQSPVSYARAVLQYRKDIRSLVPKGNILQRALVRGKTAKAIRAELGVKLYRWTKADVEKASKIDNEKVRIEETRRSYNVATQNGTSGEKASRGSIGEVKKAAEEGTDIMNEDMAKDTEVRKIITNGGGISNRAITRFGNIFEQTLLKTAVSVVNPAYAIAVPACLMYQASIQNSGDNIDANNEQAQRFGLSVASAGDAQAYTQLNDNDRRVDGRLTGGLVEQLNSGASGSIYESNVEKMASGRQYDTTDTFSAQGSPAGVHNYDIFSTFLDPDTAKAFGGVAQPLCEYFTNVWTGTQIAIGTIALSVIPGMNALIQGGGRVTAGIVTAALARQTGQTMAKLFTKKELTKLALIMGATELGALLAKVITINSMGGSTNGTAQGADAANLAHMGMDAYAQENARKFDYSVPLTTPELAKVKEKDTEYMNQTAAENNVAQRYLDPHNADSLVARMAMMAYAKLNLGSVASLLNSAAKIFNPFALPSLLSSLSAGRAHAISGVAQTDYGIVQWGWTVDEEDAYINNPRYSKFYNQEVLENSGKEAEIKEKYGKCFEATIGTLLSDGHIRRDDNANVIDNADLDCSPTNLGMDNKQGFGDLVFRWRVANRHLNALNASIGMEG